MCAGMKIGCDDPLTCAYHAFGPCGGVEEPSMYVEVHIESFMAVIDSETYLTDKSQVQTFAPSNIPENGYRRYSVSNGENAHFLKTSANASARGGSYANLQAGAYYGKDPSASGAWLGVSNYLLTKGNMTTRTNTHVFPAEPRQPREEAGSVEVCISDLAFDPLSCGTARTFREGEFMFSLLGSTVGSDFEAGEDVTRFGIRTRLDLVGTSAAYLSVNDGETLESIGSSDVTKLVLGEPASSGRELTIEFPSTYNVGMADPAGFMIPYDMKDVRVKVSQVQVEGKSLSSMATASSVESIYVDYLFEMPTVQGSYVIYDPRVVETTEPGMLDSVSFVFDPIRFALGFTMLLYFVGCNYFVCTSDCSSAICTKI
jgi:hypothetical protein